MYLFNGKNISEFSYTSTQIETLFDLDYNIWNLKKKIEIYNQFFFFYLNHFFLNSFSALTNRINKCHYSWNLTYMNEC